MTKILFLSALVLVIGAAMAQTDISASPSLRRVETEEEKASLTLIEYCRENPNATFLYYKQTFKCSDYLK